MIPVTLLASPYAAPSAMRACTLLLRFLLLGVLLPALPLAPRPAAAADQTPRLASVFEGYRVDSAGTLQRLEADEVLLLPPEGPESWPVEVREDLERRVVAEWNQTLRYGVVRAGVGARLAYPLVTARLDGRVVVPVVEGHELPVRGSLDLLVGLPRRRIAVLVDTSASSERGPRASRAASGPVWPDEWRALEQALAVASREPVDLAVIPYGSVARPLVPPGTPPDEAARAIEQHRRAHPGAAGRTDTACALWLGREWLEDTPADTEAHLVLMTDGSPPDSGRFSTCRSARRLAGPVGGWVCERFRNTEACPASHAFDPADGASDWNQLEHFAGALPERIHLHALVFSSGSDRERYERFADRADGRYANVLGPALAEQALLDVIAQRAVGVFAVNESTGRQTRNLLAADGERFEGVLPLRSGANDVMLRIEREGAEPTLFRFRIYAEPDLRRNYLATVRQRNQVLEDEHERLIGEAARTLRTVAGARELSIAPE